jgi:tRNA(Ile2) C34 agmatinyltransferase TiaS
MARKIIKGKSLTFNEVSSEFTKKNQKVTEYVTRTGLCFYCKTSPICLGQHRCKTCSEKVNDILKRLSES